MSQNAFNESNESGAAYRTGINNALKALASTNSGTSAPATPYAQQMWVDTDTPSSTVWTLNMFDGTDWIPLGYIDSTNNVLLPFIGGGTATVASASTVDLGVTPQSTITISGTTTIASFGSTMKPGQSKIVIASGAWKLTYNSSSMKIPGSADFTMAAGDKTIVTCISAGNFDVMIFPKSGQSVASGAIKTTPYQITDTTDITLSNLFTQSNVGPTKAIVFPTKGLVRVSFLGQIDWGGPQQVTFAPRIGSTNYFPNFTSNAGSDTMFNVATASGSFSGVYTCFGSPGTLGPSVTNGNYEVALSIEALGIPSGSQTVQMVACKGGGSNTAIIRGSIVGTVINIMVEDHS